MGVMTQHQRLRRTTRLLLLLVAAALGLTTLTACELKQGEDVATSTRATAIVYSARQNSPTIDLTASSPGVDAVIDDAVDGHGTLYVVSADGAPAVRTSLTLASRQASEVASKRSRTANVSRVRQALAASVATTPEADTLGAIGVAADQVRGSTSPTVVVIDSGLATTGALPFQNGVLSPGTDIQATAQSLKAARLLPDLQGMTVHWVGMGDTTAPQGALDQAARARLEELWRSVVETAGGTLTTDSRDAVTTTAPEQLPAVTPVNVAATSVSAARISVTLPETQLAFVGDEATFLHPDQASATIAELAHSLTGSGVSRVTVTGCTATAGTPESRATLSQARAEAVRTELQAHLGGVPVTARGLGAECPGHVPDVGPDGRLTEPQAQQNRVTVVTAE